MDNREIAKHIKALQDTSDKVRLSATEALRIIGVPAVPALIKALQQDEYYEDKDLGAKTYRVVWSASEALRKIGDPAVPALIEALRNGSDMVRQSAAQVLGKIGDASAVPALLEVLKDENKYVREYVAKTLGEIGDDAAVPALLETLLVQF